MVRCAIWVKVRRQEASVMVTATVEERLSRIEGAYEHLATKADVSQLEIRRSTRRRG